MVMVDGIEDQVAPIPVITTSNLENRNGPPKSKSVFLNNEKRGVLKMRMWSTPKHPSQSLT